MNSVGIFDHLSASILGGSPDEHAELRARQMALRARVDRLKQMCLAVVLVSSTAAWVALLLVLLTFAAGATW